MKITTILSGAILALTIFGATSAQAYAPENIREISPQPLALQNPSETKIKDISTPNNNIRIAKLRVDDSIFSPRNIEPKKATSPLGFQIFCMQNSVECKSSSTSKINYSFRLMRTLANVNREVNASIEAQNDLGIDKWTLNPEQGDCEDYLLTKRSILAKSGIDIGALRIATATTSTGEGHAVLIVKTNRGDFVLDNRTNLIKPFNRTDLSFIAISGVNPYKWIRIS